MSAGAEIVNAVAAQPSRLSILPDAQQLEMLRDPSSGELSRHNIHLVRSRGRPKNAKNKRSKKVADYFVAQYGDPIDVLGQLTTMPLKTLVDVLMEADGGAEHRARLTEMVEDAVEAIKSLRRLGKNQDARDSAEDLEDAIEKLARAAQAINGKPGKLALDALSLQLQAAFRALEYVHGKQPISIDVAGKADLVIFAPEILKAHGIDAVELQAAVEKRGIEAFDPEAMRIVDATQDAEFTEIEGEEGAPE